MFRMKKKFYLLLVAALSSMFALAGCGTSGEGYKKLTAYTNEDSQTETISNDALELPFCIRIHGVNDICIKG